MRSAPPTEQQPTQRRGFLKATTGALIAGGVLVTAPAEAQASEDPLYRALAASPDTLIFGDIERNGAGAVTRAAVVWPDGTTGSFTATASEMFPSVIEAYEITYGDPVVRTYRQSTMTRDKVTGAVTGRPPLTVE